MGFRFRRSIKLVPGVRLNVSTRGASLSVGGRGATLNLSGRGARATFGIPGTGLSWSESLTPKRNRRRASSPPSGPIVFIDSIDDLEDAVLDPNTSVVYRASGRRLSSAQIEAARRRLQAKKRREQASAQLADAEGKQRDILNVWRNTTDLPAPDDYEDACLPRPFEFEEAPPAVPHQGAEESKLLDQIRSEVRASTPRPPATYVALAAIPVLTASASLGAAALASSNWTLAGAIAAAVAGSSALLTKQILDARRTRAIEAEIKRVLPERWIARAKEIAVRYEAQLSAFNERRANAEREWTQAEQRRTAWARRLVDGDVSALEEAIADTAGDLDFPFEAKCDVAIGDDRTVYLHVDLPEIEDVVPETRGQVLKDGRVRQAKRTATERNADYALLVTGLGLFLANEVFVVSPKLERVQLAAYTQRKKRGADNVVDAYVYDVRVTREYVAGLDFADVDPLTALLGLRGAIIEQKANLELKAHKRPAWTVEFDAGPAREGEG